MPRDDLSIDFVRKMPPVEAVDPAVILDEWTNRTQNLSEEIRFLQEELAEKDRQYDKYIKEIEDRDNRIQKWIKSNGSHTHNPKEEEYRATIRRNYALAEQLSNEKLALTQKLQQTMDKHIRHLDMQIKMLYDRGEPGFTDPDELPSLLRPSAANIKTTPALRPVNGTAANKANNASQSSARAPSVQIRNAQVQHLGSNSAPNTPAPSVILNRQQRESSAGPGNGVPKRGPRLNTSLSNLPATSSNLARHPSLGPGTPKSSHTPAGPPRAGSAGPRISAPAKGGSSSGSRKAGTPSSVSGSRKKGTPTAPGGGSGGGSGGSGGGGGSSKSGLSRVKRPNKNSPSSNAESELSDADSGSEAGDSNASQSRGRNTPSGVGSIAGGGGGQGSRSGSGSNQGGVSGSGAGGGSGGANGTGNGGNNKEGSTGADKDSTGGPTNGNNNNGGGGGHHSREHSSGHPGGGPGSGGIREGGGGHSKHHHQHQPGRRLDHDDDDEDAMDVDDDDAGDDKKYCLCQNVSFGDMVACDNDDCPYEWFHWGCVGLKSEPNGAWFCPVCIDTVGGGDFKKKGSNRAGS